MNELAQELFDLVNRAKSIEADNAKKTQSLVEREALCATKENDLGLRKASLDVREAQLVPIENMAQWKKDVQAQADKNASEREALESDKKKWATQVQADKSQIEQDRLTAKRESDNNDKNRANFDTLVLNATKEKLIQFGHPDLASKI